MTVAQFEIFFDCRKIRVANGTLGKVRSEKQAAIS